MITTEQKNLLGLLCAYSLADKDTCLWILQRSNREKPEYGLRTLKRWGYITKRKDGLYGITEKGLAYVGVSEPVISCGGNKGARQRLAKTARAAALLGFCGIPGSREIPGDGMNSFIPSPIWRNIREGLTSTVRFNGMLFWHGCRLVVYHVGNGEMSWQTYAERSLFFQNYGRYDDRAMGMLLICDDGLGVEIANDIIRHTMQRRKYLLGNREGYYFETDKPQKYSKSPIRLHDQYSRAFLTEEQDLSKTLDLIKDEERMLKDGNRKWEGSRLESKNFWDVEAYPTRMVFNLANDLLKYLYLFDYLKDMQSSGAGTNIDWNLALQKKYLPLTRKYESMMRVHPWE